MASELTQVAEAARRSRQPRAAVPDDKTPPSQLPELAGELLDAVLTLAPDAVVVVDASGAIVAANALAEQMFGYPAGAMTGRSVESLLPEPLRERHRRHREGYGADARRRPMGANLSLSARRHDGGEFPVDISLAPVESGGRRLVVAAVRDMTLQREGAAAQAALAAIISTSTDAIISMSPAGVVETWNPAAERLCGFSAEEMLGRHISELVPPESAPAIEELMRRASEGRSGEAIDTTWRTRSGELIDVAVSMSRLGDGREPSGFSAIGRDIRDRKAAERELRRLLTEEARLERQHAAMADIRLQLLAGGSLESALQAICDHCAELLDAKAASVAIVDGASIRLVCATGAAAALVGRELPVEGSFAGATIERAEVLEAGGLREVSRVALPEGMPDGPALGLPVISGGTVRAALSVVRAAGEARFDPAAVAAAEALASQAALSFELEQARRDREQMALASDRERIARDLHDHVIQQLFATGMSLQSLLPLLDRVPLAERVAAAIDALDETIREIRNTIYGLTWSETPAQQLRAKVLEVLSEAEQPLGFSPTVRFEGPIDVAVPPEVAAHVVAVVQEALSNVARHAKASTAAVHVLLENGVVRVVVTDDGIGIGEPARSSGLANLESRARLLGGRFTVGNAPTGGTSLEWAVPLH